MLVVTLQPCETVLRKGDHVNPHAQPNKPLRKRTVSLSRKSTMKVPENTRKPEPPKADVLLSSPSAGKRALIYARVSTAQDQDANNQIDQLKGYVVAQGWRLVDTVVDIASGGRDASERQGLGKVMALAHQRRYDVLLFWSLDRFSREGSRKTIAYLTQLEGYGVGWHSFTEPYISTLGVFSDAIVALLASLARQEKLRISERTRASLQRLKANGVKLGRPVTSTARVEQARKLRGEGLPYSKIGQRLGVSRVRAYQMVNE
jgi:putative DNA-invertase from lambdoid prophage Rac